MSDIGFQGAADLLTALIGIGLVLLAMLTVPFGMWALQAFGVRVTDGMRSVGQKVLILLGLALVVLIGVTVHLWS